MERIGRLLERMWKDSGKIAERESISFFLLEEWKEIERIQESVT